MMQEIIDDVGLLCVCAGLDFGTHNFGFNSLESGQIGWSEQQSCINIILHVYMEGNVSSENKFLEVTTLTRLEKLHVLHGSTLLIIHVLNKYALWPIWSLVVVLNNCFWLLYIFRLWTNFGSHIIKLSKIKII